jgi:hypothetical protein
MEEGLERVVSLPTEVGLAEERMLGAELAREMVARQERGDVSIRTSDRAAK